MEHIEVWKTRKAREEIEHKANRAKADRKEGATTQAFRDILAKHGGTLLYTNGYVYEFQYKGWIYHFVNQDSRLVGCIHRPFVSRDDEECFRDMESEMHSGHASSLVGEYGYRSFLIDGKPVRALKRLLRM